MAVDFGELLTVQTTHSLQRTVAEPGGPHLVFKIFFCFIKKKKLDYVYYFVPPISLQPLEFLAHITASSLTIDFCFWFFFCCSFFKDKTFCWSKKERAITLGFLSHFCFQFSRSRSVRQERAVSQFAFVILRSTLTTFPIVGPGSTLLFPHSHSEPQLDVSTTDAPHLEAWTEESHLYD